MITAALVRMRITAAESWVYFRDIVLGEQNEEVYDHTNNAEIALAFREAGEISGS